MQETIVAGISMWWRWQPDRGVNFNSWLVEGPAGAFVVDPLEPDDRKIIDRCRSAGVRTIVVTNRDHERAAARFASELDARIVAAEPDAALMSIPVDRAVRDGDDVLGWRAIVLDGYKTPGEMVLFSRTRRTAISGDAFWGAPAGALRLMPDEKLADPVQALLSARRIRALEIDHLFVGDGMPIFGTARAALGALIDGRAADAPVESVNLAELRWTDYAADPAPFTAQSAEIGLLLGAERLGVAAARIRPGEAYCPLHWHTREEEVFLVWSGSPTLRTPAGTRHLSAGDCVRFGNDPRGAHRLSNETDEPATIVMISNLDPGDVCVYPDSRKLVVEATGTFVRSEPQLEYFDGERSRA